MRSVNEVEVKLNQAQANGLRDLVLPGTPFSSLAEKIMQVAPGRFSFRITKEIAEEVRELSMDRFQEIGIGPDSEPNATGLLLEELTDLLYSD